MSKDFFSWHALKTDIERDKTSPLFREREIWWCSLGLNVGIEEDGKHELFQRPILVFRKFNKEMLWALPMTSKKKEGKFYHSFDFHEQERTALLSQIRTISAKRLIRRLGKMNEQDFFLLQQAFVSLINETDPLRSPRVPDGNL